MILSHVLQRVALTIVVTFCVIRVSTCCMNCTSSLANCEAAEPDLTELWASMNFANNQPLLEVAGEDDDSGDDSEGEYRRVNLVGVQYAK